MAHAASLVFLGDGRLQWLELPVPQPGPNEVRIAIKCAAVCGTDVHKRARPAARQPVHRDGRPVVSGHEPAGVVDALGEGTTGLVVGQRVLVAGVVGCGKCDPCRAGYNTACDAGARGLHGALDGSNGPYIVVPSQNAVPLPNEISFEVAATLTCAGGTAATILHDTNAVASDMVVIVGLGPVGLSVLLLAKSMGASVAGIDTNEDRLEQARMLGADFVANATDPQVIAAVRAWAHGRGADVVAECAGTAQARAFSVAVARRRGRVALAGIGEQPDPTSLAQLAIVAGVSLHGIAATPLKLFGPLLAQVAEHKLPFDALITPRFSLERAPEALDLMATGRCGKVILEVA
jgi:threonine dehydrogenase-like Zn-dependent dehydrogenase